MLESPGSRDPIPQRAATQFTAALRTNGELRVLLQEIVPVLDDETDPIPSVC